MLDRQPSALTPLGIIVAAFGLFFLSPGREADVRVRWPAVVPARATAPSSYHQALRRALQARPAPRILPPDARDAVAGLADWEPRGRAAQPGARLVAGKGDWRSSFWNDRFVEISAARREPDGRVTRSRAPAQAASLPLPHRGEGRVNAEQKQRLPSPRPLPNGGKGNAGSRQTPGRSHAAHRDPRSEETAKDRAALEQVEEEERWTFDEPDGPLPPQVGAWLKQFHEGRAGREARRAERARRIRLSLRSLLGKGRLRPPTAMLVPPEFPRLSPPPLGPDGRPLRARQLKPEDFDRLRPPESEAGYKRWANDAHRGPPHWHAGAAADYHHDAQRWGALLGAERWAWIVRSGGNWWTWAEQTPVVWHAERWWCFKNDSWFLLHDGQAWAYRFFADLRRDGLFEPRTRIRVVYSEDARRAAISLPGQDTVVYDVESGREVGRLPEREPAREKAKAPRL